MATCSMRARAWGSALQGSGAGAWPWRWRSRPAGMTRALAQQAGGDDQGATKDDRGGGHQVTAGQPGLFP